MRKIGDAVRLGHLAARRNRKIGLRSFAVGLHYPYGGSSTPVDINNRKVFPPFAALRAFEAVGRLGGIRRAASALALDHAVVSRHLRSLEEWVGTPLVDRSGGRIVLTPLGQNYHAQVSAAFMDIAQATAGLMEVETSRRLVVSCVPGFCTVWLASAIDAFQQANPAIGIEVCPTETTPDLNRMEADIDIRYEVGFDASNVAHGLRGSSLVLAPTFPVASPGYLASVGPMSTPESLLDTELLHEESFKDWTEWFQAHGVDWEERIDGTRLWHAHLAVESARRGRGIALANAFLVGEDLVTGKLVDVRSRMISEPPPLAGDYVFYSRVDRWNAPSVARLRKWLTTRAEMALAA